jgi:hypothetical protein
MGDRARTLDSTVIATHLNAVWQYELPEEIPGLFREEEVRIALPTQETIDLDSATDVGSANAGRIRGVLSGQQLLVDDCPLVYFDSPARFWERYSRTDTTQGRPEAVLYFGRTLTFRPVPEAGHTLAVPAETYQAALATAGIPNTLQALAVIAAAARNLAIELGYEEIAAAQDGVYQRRIRSLRGASLARPRAPLERMHF